MDQIVCTAMTSDSSGASKSASAHCSFNIMPRFLKMIIFGIALIIQYNLSIISNYLLLPINQPISLHQKQPHAAADVAP